MLELIKAVMDAKMKFVWSPYNGEYLEVDDVRVMFGDNGPYRGKYKVLDMLTGDTLFYNDVARVVEFFADCLDQ